MLTHENCIRRIRPAKMLVTKLKFNQIYFIYNLKERSREWDISSVQFGRSVMSDSLQLPESQHARPVYHQLPEFTQTHIHRVGDAIQPSHPLSSPSPPAPNPSQHQSLFQWVSFHVKWLQYWSFSFSIIPSKEYPGLIFYRMDWLDLLAVQGLSRVFSNTTVQKHQFFGTQLSSQSNSHIHTWPQEKP